MVNRIFTVLLVASLIVVYSSLTEIVVGKPEAQATTDISEPIASTSVSMEGMSIVFSQGSILYRLDQSNVETIATDIDPTSIVKLTDTKFLYKSQSRGLSLWNSTEQQTFTLTTNPTAVPVGWSSDFQWIVVTSYQTDDEYPHLFTVLNNDVSKVYTLEYQNPLIYFLWLENNILLVYTRFNTARGDAPTSRGAEPPRLFVFDPQTGVTEDLPVDHLEVTPSLFTNPSRFGTLNTILRDFNLSLDMQSYSEPNIAFLPDMASYVSIQYPTAGEFSDACEQWSISRNASLSPTLPTVYYLEQATYLSNLYYLQDQDKVLFLRWRNQRCGSFPETLISGEYTLDLILSNEETTDVVARNVHYPPDALPIQTGNSLSAFSSFNVFDVLSNEQSIVWLQSDIDSGLSRIMHTHISTNETEMLFESECPINSSELCTIDNVFWVAN